MRFDPAPPFFIPFIFPQVVLPFPLDIYGLLHPARYNSTGKNPSPALQDAMERAIIILACLLRHAHFQTYLFSFHFYFALILILSSGFIEIAFPSTTAKLPFISTWNNEFAFKTLLLAFFVFTKKLFFVSSIIFPSILAPGMRTCFPMNSPRNMLTFSCIILPHFDRFLGKAQPDQKFLDFPFMVALKLYPAFLRGTAACELFLELFCKIPDVNLFFVNAPDNCVIFPELLFFKVYANYLAFFRYCLANTKLFHESALRTYITHAFLPTSLFRFFSLSSFFAFFSCSIVIILARVFFIFLIWPGFFIAVPIATCAFILTSSFLSSAIFSAAIPLSIPLISLTFIFLCLLFPRLSCLCLAFLLLRLLFRCALIFIASISCLALLLPHFIFNFLNFFLFLLYY